jgi:hypothetical protein
MHLHVNSSDPNVCNVDGNDRTAPKDRTPLQYDVTTPELAALVTDIGRLSDEFTNTPNRFGAAKPPNFFDEDRSLSLRRDF